jgi:hypothetical protein
MTVSNIHQQTSNGNDDDGFAGVRALVPDVFIVAVVTLFIGRLNHAVSTMRSEDTTGGAFAVPPVIGTVVTLFVRFAGTGIDIGLHSPVPTVRANQATGAAFAVAAVIDTVIAVFGGRIHEGVAADPHLSTVGAAVISAHIVSVVTHLAPLFMENAVTTARPQGTVGIAVTIAAVIQSVVARLCLLNDTVTAPGTVLAVRGTAAVGVVVDPVVAGFAEHTALHNSVPAVGWSHAARSASAVGGTIGAYIDPVVTLFVSFVHDAVPTVWAAGALLSALVVTADVVLAVVTLLPG